jgi:hypothetical protein
MKLTPLISPSILLALGSLVNLKPVEAATSTFTCPPRIESSTKVVGTWSIFIPDGKEVEASGEYENSAIYNGHPKEMASLVPDIDKTPPAPSKWDLKSEPGAYWLACSYRGTHVLYVMKLPKIYSQCSTYHKKKEDGFRCESSMLKRPHQ